MLHSKVLIADDEWCVLGNLQKLERLLKCWRSLHQDGLCDAASAEHRQQIRRPEVAINRRQPRRQPAVIAALQLPEMLVRIDPRHRRI